MGSLALWLPSHWHTVAALLWSCNLLGCSNRSSLRYCGLPSGSSLSPSCSCGLDWDSWAPPPSSTTQGSSIDNNYVTGIGNAIILRHHPCNALSASRARVETAVFIGRASHAVRDLELQGQTILLFSKFIVSYRSTRNLCQYIRGSA